MIDGLAKDWPLTEKFDSKANYEPTRKIMSDIIGADTQVGVFELPAKFNKHITNAYSFAKAHERSMKYSDWLKTFDNEAFNAQVAMKQNKMT